MFQFAPGELSETVSHYMSMQKNLQRILDIDHVFIKAVSQPCVYIAGVQEVTKVKLVNITVNRVNNFHLRTKNHFSEFASDQH